ncbi:uncharacterized protein TNCV_2858541 [Trichonephila clavipes]|nr:uncharacterized protein TNCV_2858541 [Trichonephila clavipes]
MSSRNPLAQHWYSAKSPGLYLQCRSSRAYQMALARFRNGHMRAITFVQGVKSLPLPVPVHVLDCWGISLGQLFGYQDLLKRSKPELAAPLQSSAPYQMEEYEVRHASTPLHSES